MENIIIPQCTSNNEVERQIRKILEKNGYHFSYQHPIVIADPDKTIRRIFLADLLIEKKVILEVCSCYHNKEFDTTRDLLTNNLGFKTLKILRTDNYYNEE